MRIIQTGRTYSRRMCCLTKGRIVCIVSYLCTNKDSYNQLTEEVIDLIFEVLLSLVRQIEWGH